MSKEEHFDIAVIGAGPGGYVAAIKAALLGKKVALIEKQYLGGTCLNCGCIPTKTLIANGEVLKKITKASLYGIHIPSYSIDYHLMKKRKDEVVSSIRKSLEGLLKSHGVHVFMGEAKFVSPKELKVSGSESVSLHADKIIIASGSTTLDIKAFPCDGDVILNSTSILEMTSLPESLVIVGGGYIGCEFASLYAKLGVKVTIVEALSSIIATQGPSLAAALTKAFEKEEIEIRTSTTVTSIEKHKKKAKVFLSDGTFLEADKVLISIGRKIVTDGLDLEKAGLAITDKKTLSVNDKMETTVPGIYAIGDVTGKAMLAHVASHQGIIAAANACGQEAIMHYNAVPAVIFTSPEIATVGMTLDEALAKGLPAKLGSFPFQALGKSQATIETEGFAQIVIHSKTGAILGAQVMGYDASALIAEMALAIHNELTIECLVDTIHAHPTLSEAWLEAGLIAQDTPIHFPPKIKRAGAK